MLQKDAIRYASAAIAAVPGGVEANCNVAYVADTEFIEEDKGGPVPGARASPLRETWTFRAPRKQAALAAGCTASSAACKPAGVPTSRRKIRKWDRTIDATEAKQPAAASYIPLRHRAGANCGARNRGSSRVRASALEPRIGNNIGAAGQIWTAEVKVPRESGLFVTAPLPAYHGSFATLTIVLPSRQRKARP